MRRAGFTLIELLVASGIALAIAGTCVAALTQTRSVIRRSEARVAMYADAQALYVQWHRLSGSLMQTGACLVRTTARSGDVRGSVELTFLRGKENDGDWGEAGGDNRPDLVWERWTWDGAGSRLLTASSSGERSFSPSGSFKPAGVEYNGQRFVNAVQPRRWLDPADPDRTLDDNAYFRPVPGASSAANAVDDIGDATDLARNRTLAVRRVTGFTLQLVAHDGTVTTCDDSAAGTTMLAGTWLDGRLAPRLTDRPDYATSDTAKRPRLLRVRVTLAEPSLRLAQDFAFSFALPDLAPPP